VYRLVVCNLLFSVLFSGIALSAQIDEAQTLLNRLGYNAGPVDGAYGAKTRKALERFYYDIGRSFDGNLDQNDLKNLHDEFSNLSGIKVGPFPTPQDVSTVENYVINGARIRPGSFAEKRQKLETESGQVTTCRKTGRI
jgi:peptidoglycan hydrolase-like protein with peptidoglycan-binding domain